MLAHNSALLHTYTITDGRWRLKISLNTINPTYINMLITFENQHFHDHTKINPLTMTHALVQAAHAGSIVSNSSTLTMQITRLIKKSTTNQ